MSRPLCRDDTNPPLSNWLLKDAPTIKNLPGGSGEGSGYSISRWAVTGYCLPKLYVCSPPPPRPSSLLSFPRRLSHTKGGCSERGGSPKANRGPGRRTEHHWWPVYWQGSWKTPPWTVKKKKEGEEGNRKTKKMSRVCINFLNPKLKTSTCSYSSDATKTSQHIYTQRSFWEKVIFSFQSKSSKVCF